jgi:prevent-host-death family protein
MGEVASRELRNTSRALLDRVEAGETITVTVDGRPVALLSPVGRRPRWLSRAEFVRRVVDHQGDPRLRVDVASLGDKTTTDNLPFG